MTKNIFHIKDVSSRSIFLHCYLLPQVSSQSIDFLKHILNLLKNPDLSKCRQPKLLVSTWAPPTRKFGLGNILDLHTHEIII
jgi:hypothetical protein